MARILLMPGLDGSAKLFDRFAAEIPTEHNVKAIIYPNEMTRLDELYAYAMDSIVDGEPPVVVAESFSGVLLCQMLRDQVPLRAAVFAASFSVAPHPTLISLALGMPEFVARVSTSIAISHACLNGIDDTTLKTQISECVKSVPYRTLTGRLNSLLRIQDKPCISDVPILVLAAKHDRLLDRRSKQSLRRTFQSATVVEINSPHFLLQAHPKVCWQEIARFINLA